MESEGNRRETTRKILKKMLNFRFLSWYENAIIKPVCKMC